MFISYMSNKNLQKKFDLAIKSLANKQTEYAFEISEEF